MVFLRKDIFSLDDAKRFKDLVLDTCQIRVYLVQGGLFGYWVTGPGLRG